MGSLGASWAHLGRALGASWSARRRLGAILGRVGAILECFGRIWEGFGGVLEAFWEHFGNIFKDFLPYCAKSENCKKLRKNYRFSLIFKNPGKF